MKLALFCLTILLLVSVCTGAFASDTVTDAWSDADIEFFEKRVRPVLVQRCFSCHSENAKTIQGGLRLDSRAALLAGGDSGTAIVPGEPEASVLVQSLKFNDEFDVQMPPKGKLPQREIDALVRWVKLGAPFPGGQKSSSEPAKELDLDEERSFWSFVEARKQSLPIVKSARWPRQRMDHFVLAAMEHEGLQPSPEADRRVLIRRLSFDLTGLPPTPNEVADFVNDPSPTAYQNLVARLLSRPQYGERWARVWLDLARYTDRTASWLEKIGDAHLYRDWIIKALNDDVPYDQFVRRQLATDYMPETDASDIPALGFLGLSPNYWKELKLPCEIIKVIVADEWEERVDAVSRTFLGLTVACARCHDHKFDAVSMEDYYALAGVFASSRIQGRPTIDETLYEPVRVASQRIDELNKRIAELKKEKPLEKDKIAELANQINKLQKETPHFGTPLVPAVVDETLYVERKGKEAQDGTKLVYKSEPRDLNLFIRGNPNRLGDVVPRRFLSVLARSPNSEFSTGSGRLDLANAITQDAKSLAARVIVNRVWLAHFGRGIVTTPSNFGRSGQRPTHPELLDDLAARFIENGWSMKWLHREIVMSATYRQSSQSTSFDHSGDVADSFGQQGRSAIDPGNVWISRMNRQRLTVEAWRDAMLAVAGRLDGESFGESIALTNKKNRRRTIYGTIHRRDMSTMLLSHDFPDPTAHSPKRIPTTTPLQGLYALNGPFILSQSAALAERLLAVKFDTDQERIRLAYELLFARLPTQREVQLAEKFLSASPGSTDRSTIWTQYAQVLLASSEFLYLN